MILPSIIHLVDDYLPRSETFIYQFLSKMRKTRPVVITQYLVNRHSFPLTDIVKLSQPNLMRWIRQRVLLRLTLDLLPLTAQSVHISRRYGGKVLHAHFGHVGYRALALKRATGMPLVTTFYGFDMSKLPRRRLWQRAYRRLFDAGDLFIVEGPHMAAQLELLGCPRGKIVIVPIAIDLSRIRFTPRYWDGHEPVYILMAGRFIEKKGFIYGIDAFAHIASKWPTAYLRIIGDGPQCKEIRNAVSRSGVSSRIHLLGPRDYDAYLAEANQAHLFMSPSVTAHNGDSEGGAPTALLEMQAAGLPVLSTNHADIPHIVKNGTTGFLVPERDVDALAERLDWLLAHPDRWSAMGMTGHVHILEAHNIDHEVNTLESHYLSLLPNQAIS